MHMHIRRCAGEPSVVSGCVAESKQGKVCIASIMLGFNHHVFGSLDTALCQSVVLRILRAGGGVYEAPCGCKFIDFTRRILQAIV